MARQRASTADEQTENLRAQLGDLQTALHAYVAPGQNITEWAARADTVLGQLVDEAEGLEQSGHTELARDVLRPAIQSLTKLNSGVREYLRSGDDLMAADLAFSEAASTVNGAVSALHGWREIESAPATRAIKINPIRRTLTLGGILLPLVLCLGVVGLKNEASTTPSDAAQAPAPVESPGNASAEIRSPAADQAEPFGVDLQAAAQACDALARASDGAALKAALGHGAAALGAKGVVVWLGVDEQLFAVASHGYDERHLKRPIPRTAGNVTAETWRTGQAVSIPGDADAPGVVVVPMADANGCRGVVSAELLPGRVAAADRQALLSMFAAQLGGIVGASA
ncbi:MAG: hypothetical protein AB7P99_18105, partial [Vicinamibacterales bacterium]